MTARTRAEVLLGKLLGMVCTDGGYFYNPEMALDEVLDFADAERQAGEQVGMEKAAKIVEQWHIKKGGYCTLAEAIRQQSCVSVTQAQASRDEDDAVS